ncbi:MAG TPA: mercury(II) reductase [Bacteroidetes bacterium]|nr:mercury(II) reductase [Bacteroidota bacterium]
MTCTHCATGIERKFAEKEGVLTQSVDYSSGIGQFEYDSGKLAKKDLIDLLEQGGSYRVTGEIEPNTAGKDSYDLIVIGGGSAAFAAAIKADELGKRTLLINGGLPTGGTCVNVGCIPSKFLIRAAEQVYRSSHSNFAGVQAATATLEFREIIREKKALVATMREKKYLGIAEQLSTLEMCRGMAHFVAKNEIEVEGKRYQADHFLIATGTTTAIPDIPGLAETGYLTTDSLFELEEKPEELVIIGAGYIGLEIAQAYQRLGCQVTLIQRSAQVLSNQAADIAAELEQQFEKEGIRLLKSAKIERIEAQQGKALLHIITNSGKLEIMASHILLASGRQANTAQLHLEAAQVALDENGFVKTNSGQQTNVAHIYAAGDCTATPAYVYTAAAEGQIAIRNMFEPGPVQANYDGLPWVVFTDPQVAGAGMDEIQAAAAGLPFEVRVLPLSEVPRAVVAKDTRGFIKLIRDPRTDLLLGARMVGAEAGELVMETSLAIRFGIKVNELASAFHPYLTLSEGVKLAAITFAKDVAMLSCCAV